MSDDSSGRLGLPYLASGQLQKHVTLNEAIARLDALVQTAAVSRSVATEPTAADDGDLYILPAGAEGPDWGGRAPGAMVRRESGGWVEIDLPEGAFVIVLDTAEAVVKRSGEWRTLTNEAADAPTELQNLGLLGLNAEADAANPFTARLNKALWTARESAAGGDGDLRFTLNKQGPAGVLSLLLQSGWSGRAELGLVGDDDLKLKVSADGATWREVFSVDRSTGRASFTRGAGRHEIVTVTESGPWTPPVWAQRIEAICVGGGGGGGAGATGAVGTIRHGGGGGGAGGVAAATWAQAGLTGDLLVTVGSGGAGGATAGQAGSAGADTAISLAGVQILGAEGGRGGGGGTTTSGPGGAGGRGVPAPTAAATPVGSRRSRPGRSTVGPMGRGVAAPGAASRPRTSR